MGRYSPPAYVTDRSGELLAQALEQASSGFFGGIERGRERRHQRDIEKQQHDDAILGLELSHPGLHRPGAPVPTGQGNALASALPNSPLIDDEYGSGQGPVASPSGDMGFGHSLADALPMPATSATAPMPMKPANSGRGALPPAAPVSPASGHPGAFDPATGAFRDGKGVPKIGSQPVAAPAPAAPRVRQLTGGWTMNDDESDAALMHGKELERAFADRDRGRKVQSLMKAYQIPQEKAEALVDNPGIADNALYPTAKTPTMGSPEWLRNRITELQRGGMPLAAANKQARLEAGETNAQDSSTKGEMQKMQRVLSLQGHFNSDRSFTQAQDIASAYQKIQQAASGEHTATSDMSLVYGLMKMQDPGSTVREGEYASAENAKGIPDAIRNLYNKAVDGAILSERQRGQFAQTAESLARAHRKVFAGTLKRYSDMATRYEVDPRDVVFDPFEGVLSADAAASTTTGPTREQQLWDAAVAKHGEAKVLKEYGPRPPR